MDIIYIGSFLVGIADCFSFSLALDIAGSWLQPGISLFNFGQSFTVFVISVLHILLGIQELMIVYISIIVLSSVVLFKYRGMIEQKIKSK